MKFKILSGYYFFVLIGTILVFSTSCSRVLVPQITTNIISEPGNITDLSGGTIISEGRATILSRGVCWSTHPTPGTSDSRTSDGAGAGSFLSTLTGLTPGTTYFVRAYASNTKKTGYGMAMSFTTLPASNLTLKTDNFSSNASLSLNSAEVIDSDESGPMSSPAIRVISEESTLSDKITSDYSGTGNSISFREKHATISDVDGNIYETIELGSQVWMADNLKTSHYNDGTPIPLVSDNVEWIHLRTPGFCWYDNNMEANKDAYGALYNRYTICTGKLCPSGWHVPSDTEKALLINYLGGDELAGNKMKESGVAHWKSPNEGATNSSGFTALPGGWRTSFDGTFVNMGLNGRWGTASFGAPTPLFCLRYNNSYVLANTFMEHLGFSVRCLKDN